MAEAVKAITVVEATVSALVARLAIDLRDQIAITLKQQDRFTWALSGGNTPRQLYELLAQEPYRSTIPWQRVWILWGDERCVPPEDHESNFRMANEALLQRVPIPAPHIFRMKGELPPREAAHEYETQLRSVFADQAFPAFDVILLGMGPDGHTASLFPKTTGLEVSDHWVIDNPVPSLNTTRLTLTLPAINAARHVWFLATGAEKAPVYAHVRQEPSRDFPASLISPQHGALRWYVDETLDSLSNVKKK